MSTIVMLADLEALKGLLAANDLPVSDIDGTQLFFGIHSGAVLVAAVGLELRGPDALLRSLVVADSHRNHGLAQELVRHAEIHASAQGAETLYLLTTTAQDFFKRLGFIPTPRAAAPVSIAAASQFSGLCCASAVFLSKPLGNQ